MEDLVVGAYFKSSEIRGEDHYKKVLDSYFIESLKWTGEVYLLLCQITPMIKSYLI